MTGEIQLQSAEGPLTISGSENLTLSGPGASNLSITNAAGNTNELIDDTQSASVNSTISGLTLTGGGGKSSYASAGGVVFQPTPTPAHAALTLTDDAISANQGSKAGGIYQAGGSLTLSDTTLEGNTAQRHGGGIYSQGGSLKIESSTISGNTAPNGAGIAVGTMFSGDTVTLDQGTVADNRASASGSSYGGGLLIAGQVPGAIKVVDSTISGNQASIGAGISFGGPDYPLAAAPSDGSNSSLVAVDNSTIADNTASSLGGGMYLSSYTGSAQSATIHLQSTIVAGNTAAGKADDLADVKRAATGGFDATFSLIQTPGSAPLSGSTNIIGKDPLLGPLANNGGPTQTMLPAPDSPVIDRDKALAGVNTDQRGGARTVVNVGYPEPKGGDGTDIGAVELASNQVVSRAPAPPPPPAPPGPPGPPAPPPPAGPPAPPPPGPQPPAPAPTFTLTPALAPPLLRLYHVRVNPHNVRLGAVHTHSTGKHRKHRKPHVTISYRDTAAAHADFRVYQKLRGVKHHHRCVATHNGKTHVTGKRCTRLVLMGAFTHHDHQGTNRVRLPSRLDHHKLRAGKYRFTAVAKLNGRHSRAVHGSFKVLRAPTHRRLKK